ncbi:MAG: type IV pilus twitching motility protein PilT [Elusimicrobia bacterium]|nr:type IV pilus twitching motility protein PilT [Elusimicrobiota bacterium]
MADIYDIVKAAVEMKASDILLVPGEPPTVRISGELRRFTKEHTLDSAQCQEVVYSMLDRKQISEFEDKLELDCSYTFPEVGRFRVNVLRQENGIAAVMRVVNEKIPTPEELGIPPSVVRLTELPRGLVLVTGPTGSGKSTTLASLVEQINGSKSKHIITIEDPIEYCYRNKKSIIDQREVGMHTRSFTSALKHSLRQNPDIILVGEMRDRETIALALAAAETGHLCFSTLHTQDAASTVDRMIDEFPLDAQVKLRAQLSTLLTAVVSQVMLPRKGGGMICAREVMILNSAVATHIREGKIHQLPGVIESGGQFGMISMDQCLALMVGRGEIEIPVAMAKARDPQSLKALLSMRPMSAPASGPAPATPVAAPVPAPAPTPAYKPPPSPSKPA